MLIPSDEFLMLLRRALNTLDPQKAPKWAMEVCAGLEEGVEYVIFPKAEITQALEENGIQG